MFPSEICEIFKKTFFYRTPLVTSSGWISFEIKTNES